MNLVIANQVSSVEAANLVQQGHQLQCPVCAEILKTIPENLTPGEVLHGIECPTNQKHFMIHYDDESAMKKMRLRMKERSGSDLKIERKNENLG
jgi:hypothetical protein